MLRTLRGWLLAASVVVVVGVAALGTRVAGQTGSSGHLNTPLFSVRTGETAAFNLSLDDVPGAGPVVVYYEFINRQGAVVLSQTVTVAVGKTVTLNLATPGQYRAHAEVIDTSMGLSARRSVVGGVEIGSLTTGTGCIRFIPSMREPPDGGPQ